VIRRRLAPAIPRQRLALLAAAAIAASLALASALAPGSPVQAEATALRLADRLEPQTWAFAIPLAWMAAPLAELRAGDVIDLIGTRTSERANASEVARGLRVMSLDERSLVVELTAEDATAIAEARARGLSFVPILRSSR
jgi:hypothetical protein